MASKKQIAEQALRIISGGHLKPDRTIDIREVMLHLDQLRDAVVVESTMNNIKNGNYSIDDDYLSFDASIAVQAAGANGLQFITITGNLISLPIGLGLYQITPVDDMEDAYDIVQPGAVAMHSGSQALERSLNTYCWNIGNTVYFKNVQSGVTVVTVLAAISSKDIAETADYPVPPDVEARLLQGLVSTFGVEQQAPHDEREDGLKQ